MLCIRVVSPGHINLEEGNALVSYIRWILRSRSRFRHRVVILIDSSRDRGSYQGTVFVGAAQCHCAEIGLPLFCGWTHSSLHLCAYFTQPWRLAISWWACHLAAGAAAEQAFRAQSFALSSVWCFARQSPSRQAEGSEGYRPVLSWYQG